MRRLKEPALNHILEGATLLGSGGGGPVAAGRAMIKEILERTEQRGVELAPPPFDDVTPGAGVVVVADVGAADKWVDGQSDATWNAFQRFGDDYRAAHGDDIGYVAMVETGAENTLAPMVVAARAGLPLLDGDGAGRAVPRLTMLTYAESLPFAGAVIADVTGDAVRLDCDSPALGEELLRGVVDAAAFADSAGMAMWGAPVEAVRKVLVPGSVSLCEQVGQALSEARGQGAELLPALTGVLGDRLVPLFTGTLELDNEGEVEHGGFNFGTVKLHHADGNTTATVLEMNENLLAWSTAREQPLGMAPDSLCFLTSKGVPLSCAELEDHQGEPVHLLGIKAHAVLRQPPRMAAFTDTLRSLGYYGCDLPLSSK